jgi:CheY-like chemotaxis protein
MAASRRRRILVVDDNLDAGETLVMLIESLGQETQMTGDGPSAVQLCTEWQPDIVFLDIGLPGMDGYEVAREIRRRLRDRAPRLVALTGYRQDSDIVKAKAAGFDQHLVKPASVKEIVAVLEHDRSASSPG